MCSSGPTWTVVAVIDEESIELLEKMAEDNESRHIGTIDDVEVWMVDDGLCKVEFYPLSGSPFNNIVQAWASFHKVYPLDEEE